MPLKFCQVQINRNYSDFNKKSFAKVFLVQLMSLLSQNDLCSIVPEVSNLQISHKIDVFFGLSFLFYLPLNPQIMKSQTLIIIEQMKPLQSQSKLIQIETRLNKQSYLSRSNLPGSADARMFLHLQSIKRYPDRLLYPNFYHWFVLMKQFSVSSIEKWIANGQAVQNDQLIHDLTTKKPIQKTPPEATSPKKGSLASEAGNEEQNKSTRPEECCNSQSHEIQYIMDVKIKEGVEQNMKELVTGFLSQQLTETPEIQEFLEQRRVRILAKMDPTRFEQLKNKISAFEGVETFETKKKDKRFKTIGSSSIFSGEL